MGERGAGEMALRSPPFLSRAFSSVTAPRLVNTGASVEADFCEGVGAGPIVFGHARCTDRRRLSKVSLQVVFRFGEDRGTRGHSPDSDGGKRGKNPARMNPSLKDDLKRQAEWDRFPLRATDRS